MTTILLDAKNCLYRFGYAHNRLTNEAGGYTGALYGFVGCLARLKRRYPDARFLAVWDGGRAVNRDWVSWRSELLSGYRVRDKPPDKTAKIVLKQQRLLEEFCELVGIPALYVPGIEADDLIAMVATAQKNSVIYSSDKDFMQLMAGGVQIIRDVDKTARLKPEDPKSVKASFGCRVENVLKIRAFLGDPSDKIPVAVRGVGPVAATKLVEVYGVDPAFDGGQDKWKGPEKLLVKVQGGWQEVRRNYKLMQLVTSVNDGRLGTKTGEVRRAVKQSILELTRTPVRNYYELVSFLSAQDMEEALERRHDIYHLQGEH